MHPNQKTIIKFYKAFAALDADTMAECYADDVQFDDEVFSLRGKREVAGMWRMLTDVTRSRAKEDWKLEFSGLQADASTGQAHWDAHYRFSATGRLVLNHIDARFTFNAKKLITSHRDQFNFWAWSRQALGAPGLLLGWSPLLRNKVRQQANASLKKYLDNLDNLDNKKPS